MQRSDIDFVQPLRAADRKPAIFLFIVDSLRRDYLSVYNPRVAFTPEIGKLAADSFVFERAWTRYSGTALAVPAIWTGGMVPHMVRQPEFPRRNTLLKLLEANDYLRMMDIDVHVEALVPHDDRLVNLDPRRGTMDLDLCTTVPELERTLSDDRKRPAFFYSLSQNVHLAVAPKRKVPPGETYPAGFDPRMASSLRRLDGCLGGFVAYLKREHLYDDSIIILTSDHGDSLGEEGRWGHAFWMYPEVMNIPLIVHVPSWLKARVRTDLDALVFSTDIAPTLYALLGYEPKDLGPLFGRSLFTPRDGESSRRRREAFLVASSYGAVYGVVSQNGRRLYVVDTVNRTEYALDMSAEPRRLVVTPPETAINRRFIEQQLSALAAVYRYRP